MYLIKISSELDEALNLTNIGEQRWLHTISQYCSEANKDEESYFKDVGPKTRQEILQEFCSRGPSEYLRKLLNADALLRGEWCSVQERAKERLASLEAYVQNPPNARGQDDKLVLDAKQKLNILIMFMKEHNFL